MTRFFRRVVPVVVVLVLAIAFWASLRTHPVALKADAATGAPARVTIVLSRSIEIPVLAEGIGTVRSRRQTQIASRVLAEVKEVLHHPGDQVAKGDPLLVLDDRDLAARVAQSQALLLAREHALKEAEIELGRVKGLVPSGAASEQQLDAASFRQKGAAAERDAAEKALEEAKIELGYASIAAPFAGYVFEKLADPGDLAQPGRPLLGLYDPKQLRLEAAVEEAYLWAVKVGDRVRVSIDAVGRSVEGQVSEVVPAIDPSSRTALVKIDLPEDPSLHPGMFGRAELPFGRRAVVAVPRGAVVSRGQLDLVFEVSADDRRARMRIVRLGPALPAPVEGEEWVEVQAGLPAGLRIVASGASDLRDGAEVLAEERHP